MNKKRFKLNENYLEFYIEIKQFYVKVYKYIQNQGNTWIKK